MWSAFFLENAHFALNLFAALVCFGVSWLYFDAWKVSKRSLEAIRVVGFIFLSFAYLVHAVFLETLLFSVTVIPYDLHVWLGVVLRVCGYVSILLSLIFEKLQSRPTQVKTSASAFLLPLAPLSFFQIGQPFLTLLITFFYLRRATKGLERHVRQVAYAFGLLTLSEFVSLASLWRGTGNAQLYELVSPLGVFWCIEHILFLLAFLVLGRWIFGYLLKQFQTQLFMILSILTLSVFIITTVAFTGLLVSNIQTEVLNELESDGKTLQYALSTKREESVSNAEFIAQNSDLVRLASEKNKDKVGAILEQFLLSKGISKAFVADETGIVLSRGEDQERVGDSVNGDPFVKRALVGEVSSGVISREGVLAPELSIAAAAPIYASADSKRIVGVVLLENAIDNAFVDGVKKVTGLDASLYGDATISSTTLLSSDGKTRLTGMKEQNRKVEESVLVRMQTFKGASQIETTPYFSVYIPVTDLDNVPVGMLSVGRPQYSVLQTTARSIELTFLVCSILLVLSIIPSFLISKYLANQLN